MSGLDKLVNLNVLSLGNNLIQNYQGDDNLVFYLRNLNCKLEVLTLMGNKCATENNTKYKYYVVAFLPQLKYLDYELIDKGVRDKAYLDHEQDIKDEDGKRAQLAS